ncbi:hypothetical protein BDZ91DRAFT_296153 [Kalaharituber pfeilii]|nr:hypothetical protein BDZ91DRAFT_296153 [Kalaharituber pfeilii]
MCLLWGWGVIVVFMLCDFYVGMAVVNVGFFLLCFASFFCNFEKGPVMLRHTVVVTTVDELWGKLHNPSNKCPQSI